MHSVHRSLSLVAVLIGGALMAAAPALAKTIIKPQPQCPQTSGYCFGFNGDSVPTSFRTIAFTAPTAGIASVTFHGSLYCANTAGTSAVLDFATQIQEADVAANASGPGGLRHVSLLAGSTQTTVNLASTRVFAVSAGAHTYRFKVTELRIDTQIVCYLYNATFTVTFTDGK